MNVGAEYFHDLETFRERKVAGSIHCTDPDEFGEVDFWYCCPCGCSSVFPLSAGLKFKPPSGPSWEWNGSKEKPTLIPSVNHENHWHGWLTDGEWKKI